MLPVPQYRAGCVLIDAAAQPQCTPWPARPVHGRGLLTQAACTVLAEQVVAAQLCLDAENSRGGVVAVTNRGLIPSAVPQWECLACCRSSSHGKGCATLAARIAREPAQAGTYRFAGCYIHSTDSSWYTLACWVLCPCQAPGSSGSIYPAR